MEQETTRKNSLSQEQAEKRKQLLLNNENDSYYVHYYLTMVIRRSVDKNDKYQDMEYEGKLTALFNYYPKNNISSEENLFLEFTGKVDNLRINGVKIDVINEKDDKIFLNFDKLKPNSENEIVIHFSQRYNHGGVGLHHYIDPVDNKEYLYTQFEPYDCHQMFPCFDQPDIKATLDLSVIAPNEWVVLANEFEKFSDSLTAETLNSVLQKANLNQLSKEDQAYLLTNTNVLNLNYNFHSFNTTPRISSYLFALCAGQYYCINNPTQYEVPLRIFCRESLKNSGDPNEMFRITIEGMEWYKEFFGIKYPFTKYDQIYCPEYNMGAMENVGLVTFNEHYCFKEPPTQRLRTVTAIVILHELAHMWFGNLVTMKWWNDLWLNESFATFISHLCLSEAKGLKDYTTSWQEFNVYKGYAFSADQKSSTHPVMGEVKNTEVAETHFDEIVYEKGSSILQQLFKFIGFDNFSKGIKSYFEIYKWQNTEFNDFITQMVKATGNENLYSLCDSFLKKAGLTEVNATWEVNSDNKVQRFNIHQRASLAQHPNLQHHLCDVMFLYGNDTTSTFSDIHINAVENTLVTSLDGTNAPDAVIVNYNDWAYFKLNLDQKSVQFLQNNLYNSNLNLSVLTRQIFYRSIFDNIRDSVIPVTQYFDTISKLLPLETVDDLINNIVKNLVSIVSYYIPQTHYDKYQQISYNLVLNLLKRPNQNKDAVKHLIVNLITLTYPDNKEQISLLKEWLENGLALYNNNEKLNIDSSLFQQKHRFNALYQIFASNLLSVEDKFKLLENECTRDNNSDESVLARFQCRASLPDLAIKQELFNMYVNDSTKESLYKMISSMTGFVQRNQIELVQEFVLEKFFDVCLDVGKKNEHMYTSAFIESFFPILFVRKEVIERVDQLVEKAESDSVRRKLIEELDDLKRIFKSHEFNMQYLNQV